MASGVIQISGLDEAVRMLEQLPKEIVSKNGGPVRAALRKAAMVIVNEARAGFDRAVALPGRSGITDSTGFTTKNIVAKRRNPPDGINGEKFVITVNSKVHPGGRIYNKKPIKTNDIAFIMEQGSAFQPATPWLRPAFNKKAEESIRVFEKELLPQIERFAQRYLKQQTK